MPSEKCFPPEGIARLTRQGRGVAADDTRVQLREAEEAIDLVIKRVAITRPAEVARAVRESTDANLIMLTRVVVRMSTCWMETC